MARVSRKVYFGSGRVDNVYSLPCSFHEERTLNGTNVYLYPVPDAVYIMKVWGKFSLDQLDSLDDDLALVYEPAFLNYMRYKLAQAICFENAFTFKPEAKQNLEVLEKNLNWQSPRDLTVSKVSTLNTNSADGLDFANTLKITGGFLPGGY